MNLIKWNSQPYQIIPNVYEHHHGDKKNSLINVQTESFVEVEETRHVSYKTIFGLWVTLSFSLFLFVSDGRA